jgi:hypothetical protein
MKYIAFDINEINGALQICRGEVMRYEDLIASLPPETQPISKVPFQLTLRKWEGQVLALEEILKFGKEIELDEIH